MCAGPSDKMERIVRPALERVAPDAPVIVERGHHSIHAAYNAIIEKCLQLPDVEGLVLLHDDVELRDPDTEQTLRETLADPKVGIVGVVGGRTHVSMPWWEGSSRAGRVTDNQQGELNFGRGTHHVDTVDGLLLVFSPAALQQLRFDERRFPRSFHGYDADICSQARAAGLAVMVADIDVHHHNNTEAWRGDALSYSITDLAWQLKWRRLAPQARLRMQAEHIRLRLQRWRRDTRATT